MLDQCQDGIAYYYIGLLELKGCWEIKLCIIPNLVSCYICETALCNAYCLEFGTNSWNKSEPNATPFITIRRTKGCKADGIASYKFWVHSHIDVTLLSAQYVVDK